MGEPSKWPSRLWLYSAFFFAASLTIYVNYLNIHRLNLATGVTYLDASTRVFQETLAGTRSFPYQWRVLGIFLIDWVARLTGADIHAIDVVLKCLFLFLSTLPLYEFASRQLGEGGGIAAVMLMLLLVSVGLADEYSIYNTNDLILLAGWHFCVYFAFTGRWRYVALFIFFTTFAREVTVLACLLAGLGFLRRKVSFLTTFLVGVAFLVPWTLLHVWYPAPVSSMAWWHNFHGNIPILHPDGPALLAAARKTFKVLVYFNVLWVLGALHLWRRRDTFMHDLLFVGCFCIGVLYVTTDVRELRQFMPLIVVVVPAGLRELLVRLGVDVPPEKMADSRATG